MPAAIKREDVVVSVLPISTNFALAVPLLLPLPCRPRELSPIGSQRGQLVEGTADATAVEQGWFGHQGSDTYGTAGMGISHWFSDPMVGCCMDSQLTQCGVEILVTPGACKTQGRAKTGGGSPFTQFELRGGGLDIVVVIIAAAPRRGAHDGWRDDAGTGGNSAELAAGPEELLGSGVGDIGPLRSAVGGDGARADHVSVSVQVFGKFPR